MRTQANNRKPSPISASHLLDDLTDGTDNNVHAAPKNWMRPRPPDSRASIHQLDNQHVDQLRQVLMALVERVCPAGA